MKMIKEDVDNAAVELYLTAVPPLGMAAIHASFSKEYPKPMPPQYSQEAFGGETIYHDHDETTLSTPEEEKEYFKYKDELELWENTLNNRVMDFMLVHGTELKYTDAQAEEWNEKLEIYTSIPTSITKKKLLYIKTYVLTTPERIRQVLDKIMGLTGLVQEDVEAAEHMFQHSLQGDTAE